MASPSSKPLNLNRTFSELIFKEKGEEGELDLSFNKSDNLDWDSLLEGNRIVILAEAGAGKTTEIRLAAERERDKREHSFFLRIEYLGSAFESAFEVGSYDQFNTWLDSEEHGFLFLDSVDEARLKSPQDFERAIRFLSSKLNGVLHRTTIVITSRVSAWRPKSDLKICEQNLGVDLEALSEPRVNGILLEVNEGTSEGADIEESGFEIKVVGLNDLSKEQKERYLDYLGIENQDDLWKEIERVGVESLTSRPQDLEEISEYWGNNGTIGSKTQLTKYSIQRRLTERDQNRAEYCQVAPEKLMEGAKLLAGAVTMTQNALITVPDGAHGSTGISAREVLTNWSAREISELLARPVFDEAVYGNVRFHHRSVREFLCASWIQGLLDTAADNSAIQSLFFDSVYEEEVIVPTLRPILPWLVVDNAVFMSEVLIRDQNLLLEGGDPMGMPLDIKENLLHDICSKFNEDPTKLDRYSIEYFQRFGVTDLEAKIVDLLKNYQENVEARRFLLRLVWAGPLRSAVTLVMEMIMTGGLDSYSESLAIDALGEIASSGQLEEIREFYYSRPTEIGRELFRGLIEVTEFTPASLEWFSRMLDKVPEKQEHQFDTLSMEVERLLENCDDPCVDIALETLNRFLGKEPFMNSCNISKRYCWLIGPAELLLSNLISARHRSVMTPNALNLLIVSRQSQHISSSYRGRPKADFFELVSEWKELNFELFWFGVQKARAEGLNNGRPLQHYSDAWRANSYWSISPDDTDYWLDQISEQEFVDDKLVSMSVAFQIYVDGGKQEETLTRLDESASISDEVEELLDKLLNPPPPSQDALDFEIRQQEYERQRIEIEERHREDFRSFLERVEAGLPNLRMNLDRNPGNQTSELNVLFNNCKRLSENSIKWGGEEWEVLIPRFGNQIAEYYRDALIAFWRENEDLQGDGDLEKASNSGSLILGIAGIHLEWKLNPNLFSSLNENEARLVSIYAFRELNGYPSWFKAFYEEHPEKIIGQLLIVLEKESSGKRCVEKQHTGIGRLVQYAPYICSDIVLNTLAALKIEPLCVHCLEPMLEVLKSNKNHEEKIAKLAKRKSERLKKLDHKVHWLALWIRTQPEEAQTYFEQFLQSITNTEDQVEVVMNVLVNLAARTPASSSNQYPAYKTPDYLAELYLLAVSYIRSEDDINRFSEGVYIPELRDRAQDVRNGLLNQIQEFPGKGAYSALIKISEQHPDQDYRAWVRKKAYRKAESDSALSPWSTNQFVEFNNDAVMTPTTHCELANHARLQILKIKSDLENGDTSHAKFLRKDQGETDIRLYIAGELRRNSQNRFSVAQEDELADATKPDIRINGSGFDAPVPIELKVADNWTWAELVEGLEGQLCETYLRDVRSSRGIYLLVYRGDEFGKKRSWEIPGNRRATFQQLLTQLTGRWAEISPTKDHVDDIKIVGIDLGLR